MEDSRSGLKYSYRCKAFTLVELLVVIGIIALLISILLPSLNKARAKAQETQCASQLRQWGIAIQMYCANNAGALPEDASNDGTSNGQTGAIGLNPNYPGAGQVATENTDAYWFNALPTYLAQKPYQTLQQLYAGGGQALPGPQTNSLFTCPTATPAARATAADLVQNGYFMLYFAAPGTTTVSLSPTYTCYVMNSKLNHTLGNMYPTWVAPIKMSALRFPSVTVLMTEKRTTPGELSVSNAYYTTGLCHFKGCWDRFTARHRAGGNILYADGHVSWMSNADAIKYTTTTNYNQPGTLIWDPYGPAD
jgi:prepilin-type processing-associated H-X9-DG protein/prepilin-type N-terminal cleavage/methylation domain-containing protein